MSDAAFELTPEMLLRAYACGLFPMAEARDDPELFWVDPDMRGIIPLDRFHVPRRLARRIRQGVYEIAVDRAAEKVIRACAEERDETWINDQIIDLYVALHRLGHVHSVECWRDGALVGGLYGVALGGAFFGESMLPSRPTPARSRWFIWSIVCGAAAFACSTPSSSPRISKPSARSRCRGRAITPCCARRSRSRRRSIPTTAGEPAAGGPARARRATPEPRPLGSRAPRRRRPGVRARRAPGSMRTSSRRTTRPAARPA